MLVTEAMLQVEQVQQKMVREHCEIGRPVRGRWQRREQRRSADEDPLREHKTSPDPQMEAGEGVVSEEEGEDQRAAS